MSTLSENIKKYRKENKLTQKELAKLLKVAPTAVSAWELSRNKPLMDNIEMMSNIFNIKKSELLGDTMQETLVKLSDIQSVYNKLQHQRKEKVLNYANKQLKEQEAESMIEEPTELFEVITTTKLAAGLGYAFNDYDTETVYVGNKPPRHDLASFVSGDSMEPNYHNGDIVYLIDKGVSSYSGEVCAIAIGDRTYLKKVYTEKEQLRLVSINPKYDDIIIDFPPNEDTHIRIFSVVGTDSTIEI